MSIETINARLAQIGNLQRQLSGADAMPSTTFAAALQSAQAGSPVASAAGATGASSTAYDSLIQQAAAKYGLDPAILKGLIKQESGFDPSAQSPAGAQGLTQLMPATAAGLGVTNPRDPAQAIDGGARYLKEQLDRFGGDTSKALAAYNAGPGAVQKYQGVPPYAETQAYVRAVLANADQYRGQATPPLPTPSILPTNSPSGSLNYPTT
jgi:soluble lytic murein transglycosylase-like protein